MNAAIQKTFSELYLEHDGRLCHKWSGYFIEFAKDRVDDMHAFYSKDPNSIRQNQFTTELAGVSFFDSIAVFEKKVRAGPSIPVATGQWSRPVSEMEVVGLKSAFEAASQMRLNDSL